ncbi:ABC transporter ATP-binding protein [Stackebrandtia soli]|uniref:ABC transporter ATP-binding protein n=1 Tax=Stackebrandtia soli TaxID=1892856 RepID=UPI0039E7CEDD
MTAIISARDLGVRFTRGGRSGGRLRELFIHRRDRTPRTTDFWPLRHLDFDIEPGEAVGVLGSNGTGKSTLLRLITGVLIPDEGHVTRRGGVAPLIALSAGFADDLTGRENVEMVAGLHGMSRKTLRAAFDEIVDFAEVADFIDTPMRHYSSGMRVRLGFAVITRLDHPILLVDEALAVGDTRFRRKCHAVIEAMLAEGKTLVLVSHNDTDLTRFCTRGLYLDAGRLRVDGTIADALAAYHALAAATP